MAGDNVRYNVPFRAPALPYPPQVYDAQSFEEFNKILRIYFNQLDNALRNAMAVQEPYELQVARGTVPGASIVNIFGYQVAVSTSSICVWENVSAYAYPASAVVMALVSTSATDAGAATVLVSGLAADYSALSEVVTLNGTNAVNTTNAFLRINNIRMTAPASGQVSNVGTITAVNGGVTYGKILPTVGQTQMSQYSVPLGYSFYLTRVNSYAQQDGGTNNFNTYSVVAKTPAVTYSVLQSPFFQAYDAFRDGPFKYAEKTSVQWQTKTDSNTSSVGMVIEGLLIAN